MNWDSALKTKIIGSLPNEEMKEFLKSLIPPFDSGVSAEEWKRQIPHLRRELLDNVFLRGFSKSDIENKLNVEFVDTIQVDKSYEIQKLRYEIFPDYWIPALLYKPLGTKEKLPAALALRGHWTGGKADIVHQALCANLAKRGVMTLSVEFIGTGELSGDRVHFNIAHLNLTGLSGVGLFYLACKKGLDLLLSDRQVDKERVAVTGCSGGGWQSIVISALDERVTLSVPVAGYTSVRARVEVDADIGDLEQVPPDLAAVADYQVLTAMLVPKPVLLIYNEMDDCCFATARAKPAVYDAVKPVYQAFDAEDDFMFYSNVDPGTHNYAEDNRSQFYKFINKHFKLDSPLADIHRLEEILPESSLNVGLPECQETLLSLALKQARKLNAKRKLPCGNSEKNKLRDDLVRVIRLPEYEVEETTVCRTADISRRLFKVGSFTVPSTVHAAPEPQSAEIWIADGGRAVFSSQLADPDKNIYAFDILGTGESEVRYNLLMLLECAGQRTLGMQVAQIIALAKRVRSTGVSRLDLVSKGLRTYIASLLATALEPGLFNKITVSGTVASLSELIEIPCSYRNDLPLFCLGLLEIADIREIKLLLEDTEFIQTDRNVPPEFLGRGTDNIK